jgi:hypothetical protein
VAFFGSDNNDLLRQIIGQLGRVGEDLGALKQQVSDQQLAIDQIRQDANAAINTGLAENRAVVRDGLERARDAIGDPLARISTELVALRGGISQLEGRLKAQPADRPPAPVAGSVPDPEPRPQPAPATEPRPEPGPESQPRSEPDAEGGPQSEPAAEPQPEPDLEQRTLAPDPDILRAAAGIAHATIEAHRDTWAFLVQVAGNEQHFNIPGRVKDDEGFVSVRLSGPSLVAAVISLGRVARAADSEVTQAIAHHLHGKITNAVQAVIDRPRTCGEGTPVRIVIDDRAQADDGSGGAIDAGGDQDARA